MTAAPKEDTRIARYRVAEISVVAWPIMDGLSGSRYGNFGQQEGWTIEAPAVGGEDAGASFASRKLQGGQEVSRRRLHFLRRVGKGAHAVKVRQALNAVSAPCPPSDAEVYEG